MYNDIFPKEAIELYLILNLDTNNSYMEDVFYLIYHLSKTENIRDTIYNIKSILLKNNSIYHIEKYYLSNEQLKCLYYNFSISEYLKDNTIKKEYTNVYIEIKKIYINNNLDNIINIYNAKQKLYNVLDNLSSDKKSSEEFYKLINIISNYTDKNDLKSYCDYYESKNTLISKTFDFKRGKFKFNQLNQIKNLKNIALKSKKIPKNIFKYNEILKEKKKTIITYYIKSAFFQIIVMLFLFFIFHPIELLKSYISSNNTNLLPPLIVYLIINIFIIVCLFINISSVIKTNSNKIKTANNGYISNISTSASTRYNIITIYFPIYNAHLNVTFKQLTSKNVSIMDKVLVIKIHNKYLCIPNNNN